MPSANLSGEASAPIVSTCGSSPSCESGAISASSRPMNPPPSRTIRCSNCSIDSRRRCRLALFTVIFQLCKLSFNATAYTDIYATSRKQPVQKTARFFACHLAIHLAVEPGSRVNPQSLRLALGYTQRPSRLGNCQSGKESQLNQVGSLFVLNKQIF